MSSRTSRRFAALALTAVAALLPAAGATSAPSRSDKPVKTVTRAYGGGVVRQDDRDQRLRINFRGKQGDLVTLISDPFPGSPGCERTRLLRRDKDRSVPQQRSGLWRLPTSGRFTITYRQDCYQAVGNDDLGSGKYRSSVQLTRVVPHLLYPGGPAVTLKLSRGYLLAGVLRLSDARAVRVEAVSPSPYDQIERLLVPPSMERRTGPGDTFDSSGCDSYAPVIAQAGWGIAHNPPTPELSTVLTEIGCDEDVRAYVPRIGDDVWFLNARVPIAVRAVYVD